MATNTNTVVLFLRRRDNYFATNTKVAVDTYFCTLNDVTINGIETPASKYVAHVWEELDYADYVTLLQKSPNDKVKAHEIYAEYKKEISAKNDEKLLESILSIEAEKLLYFILAYPQKVVIVKSGEKDVEKRFLGYEFSNRRGNEGIHAIQRGKNIDECTKLFDPNNYDNSDKASTYVYRAFNGDYTSPIAESMQSHISRVSLIDMLTFNRDNFDKSISLTSVKVLINSKWELSPLGVLCHIYQPKTISKNIIKLKGKYKVYGANGVIGYYDEYNHEYEEVALTCRGATCGCVNYTEPQSWITGNAMVITPKNSQISKRFLYYLFGIINLRNAGVITGSAQPQITREKLAPVKIPVPPIDVQKHIVEEIGKVDKSVSDAMLRINECETEIENLLCSFNAVDSTLNTIAPFATKSIKYSDIESETYVTTDNMLQNKLGILPFKGGANISSITEYKAEDILISNIRPYLKKIWFADKEGGCSKDVLVLRSADTSKYLPKYIFYMLRRDAFFDYVMEGKKGVKMPRGNKEDIMKYKIPIPLFEEQKRIIAQIEAIELKITQARTLIENAASEKQAILDKYL